MAAITANQVLDQQQTGLISIPHAAPDDPEG